MAQASFSCPSGNSPSGVLTPCTHSPLLCHISFQRGFSTVCGRICNAPLQWASGPMGHNFLYSTTSPGGLQLGATCAILLKNAKRGNFMDKAALRRMIRDKKRVMTEAQIDETSLLLAQKLRAHPMYQQARSLYA